MSNDSILKTVLVATALCIVCSVLVSSAAVGLKPIQEFNKALETKKNIIKAAGLMEPDVSVDEAFKKITIEIVDLETGELKSGPAIEILTYDDLTSATVSYRFLPTI